MLCAHGLNGMIPGVFSSINTPDANGMMSAEQREMLRQRNWR
jgi:hypothetical protein